MLIHVSLTTNFLLHVSLTTNFLYFKTSFLYKLNVNLCVVVTLTQDTCPALCQYHCKCFLKFRLVLAFGIPGNVVNTFS